MYQKGVISGNYLRGISGLAIERQFNIGMGVLAFLRIETGYILMLLVHGTVGVLTIHDLKN